MKKLLLTGFEPFAQHTSNPTQELVLSLASKVINNFKITSVVLPVEYEKTKQLISKLIEDENPDAVISLGLAGDRTQITPELIALNYCHSETPDNAGVIKLFEKINPKSKESFVSTLPVEQMINSLKENNFDAKLSTTAGAYLCNTVMYTALQTVSIKKLNIPCGFIHIPKGLDQNQLINALTISINTL